jgi:hypothetical protein
VWSIAIRFVAARAVTIRPIAAWSIAIRFVATWPIPEWPIATWPILAVLPLGPALGRRALSLVAPFEFLAPLEARAFFVACELVLRTRIDVIATGPPPRLSIARTEPAAIERGFRFFGRRPGAAALKPVDRHVRLCLLELVERGQQVFTPLAAKCRRDSAVDDDPERMRSRHGQFRSSLFSFSISVVRFSRSSSAA